MRVILPTFSAGLSIGIVYGYNQVGIHLTEAFTLCVLMIVILVSIKARVMRVHSINNNVRFEAKILEK